MIHYYAAMFKELAPALSKFVRDVGFPVFVAGYLLLGLGPKLDALRASVDRMAQSIEAKIAR